MVITTGFLALLSLSILAPSVLALPSLPFDGSRRASEKRAVPWDDCATVFGVDVQDPHLSCAHYDVPMDYGDTKAGKAKLAVIRYAAPAPKKLGTLFVNPGGPGGSGVDFVQKSGANFSEMLEGAYDIVSWDPRGVGLTFPGAVTCFDTLDEQNQYFQRTVVETINYTIAGDFSTQEQAELFSLTNFTTHLCLNFGTKCQKGSVGKYLPYMGTSSTIRDLVYLADGIVGEDQLIDYWGFSYGTVIGINFLKMFPQRAGHVIVDGVVDPTSWVTYKLPSYGLVDSDKVLSLFADNCAEAGKDGCKLVEFIGDGATGGDLLKLLEAVHDALDELYRIGYPGSPPPAQIMGEVLNVLENPTMWSDFANNEAFNFITELIQTINSLNGRFNGVYNTPPATGGISLGVNAPGSPSSFTSLAVIGADNYADIQGNVDMEDVFGEIVGVTQNVSKFFGAVWSTGYNFGWPVRSVELLPQTSSFENLKNRVLVIGNTGDPITPFSGAVTAANILGGSGLLVEQRGVGHTSLAQSSNCTMGIISNYLLSNQVPNVEGGAHVQCEVDASNILFPKNGTSGPKRGLNMSKRRASLWR